jgi:hypothetical protein
VGDQRDAVDERVMLLPVVAAHTGGQKPDSSSVEPLTE